MISSKENQMLAIKLFVVSLLWMSGVDTKSTAEATHGNTLDESHILRKYNELIQTETNEPRSAYFGSRRSRALPSPKNNPCMNKL